MKTAVWMLSIYAAIITGVLVFVMTDKIDYWDHDTMKNIAQWSFGDQWQGLKVSELVDAWNAKHPNMLVDKNDNIFATGRKYIVKIEQEVIEH